MSTEAEHWRAFCNRRLTDGLTGLVNDPWCRRLLSEVADTTLPTGYSGRLWKFPDGSRLVATDAIVKVLT